MTTLISRCDRDTTHTAHWHRAAGAPRGDLASCPGVYPDSTDDTFDVPDLTPETLHLSHAAALVIRAHMDSPVSYPAFMAMWRELTGLDEPEALTYAYAIGTLMPGVTGTVIPF